MRITKLILQNFKSFRGSHEILFDCIPQVIRVTGHNYIDAELGANGVGKSTLFDAISWALFGKTLQGVGGAHVESRNCDEPTAVDLVMQTRTGQLHIRRVRPQKLYVNDQLVDQEELLRVIGINERIFRHSVVFSQNSAQFIDLSPSERLSFFTEILNLEVWTNAANFARSEGVSANQGLLGISAKIDTCEQLIKNENSHIAEMQKKDSDFHEQVQNDIRNLQVKLQNERELSDSITSDAKKAQRFIDDNSPTLEALTRDESAAVTAHTHLETEHVRVNDRLLSVADEFTTRDDAIVQLQDEIKSAELQFKQTRQQYTELKSSHDRAINSADAVCDKCGQPINNENAKLRLRRRLQETKQRGDVEHARVADLSEKLTRMKQESGDAGLSLSEKLTKLREELKSAETAKTACFSRVSEIKKQINDIGCALSAASMNVRDSVKARAQSAQRMRDIELEIRNKTHAESPFVEMINESIRKNKERETEMARLLEEKRAMCSTYDQCVFWADGFKELRLSIIKQTLLALNQTINSILYSLGMVGWTIEFCVDLENKKGEIMKKFDISITPAGGSPIPFNTYSGGEQQRLRLAVMMGFGDLLRQQYAMTDGIEVYDESTNFLSNEGVDDFLALLKLRAAETNRTIFVVDHKVLAPGDIYKNLHIVKTTNGSSIES